MQNAITIETITNLTMSSREIAELLGSRHRDVCICIERLMDSDAIEGMRQCRTPTRRMVRHTRNT